MSEGRGLASVPLGAGMSEGLCSAVRPATARAVLPASGESASGAALPATGWAVLPASALG